MHQNTVFFSATWVVASAEPLRSLAAAPPPEETGTTTDVTTSAGRLKFKLIQGQRRSQARSAGGDRIMELWRGQKRFSAWNHEYLRRYSYVQLKPNSPVTKPSVSKSVSETPPTLSDLVFFQLINTDVA